MRGLSFGRVKLKTMAYAMVLLLLFFSAFSLLMFGTIYQKSQRLSETWTVFQSVEVKKLAILGELERTLGYGGMIHNFKNYVLRGQDKYYQAAQRNIFTITRDLAAFQALGVSPEAMKSIATVQQVVDRYAGGLEKARAMADQGLPLASVDRTVKVNDAPAVAAIEKLERDINQRMHQESTRLNAALVSLNQYAGAGVWAILIFAAVVSSLFVYILTRLIMRPIRAMIDTSNNISRGDFTISDQIFGFREAEILHRAFSNMLTLVNQQIFEQTALAKLSAELTRQKSMSELGHFITSHLAEVLGVQCVAFFIANQGKVQDQNVELKLLATYAFKERKGLQTVVHPGEGLVGQCVLEKKPIIITDVPSDYIHIQSGLGARVASSIYVIPIIHADDVLGVIELASFRSFDQQAQGFIEKLIAMVGLNMKSLASAERVMASMEEERALNEELKSQQETLNQTNEKLEAQANALRQSEEELRSQSEELRVLNEELEEKSNYLEQQKNELESAKHDLEQHAEDLALSSKYKSEFLANMSHELRTPLNSLLILSKKLANNREGNLNDKQVRSAEIIHRGGQDLLTLINDILDLSKVEAGKMQVEIAPCSIAEICQDIEAQFLPMAQDKGLALVIDIAPGTPESFFSDAQRLMQILRNFISNALKFTEQGEVRVQVGHPRMSNVALLGESVARDHVIAWSVSDTGIGIAPSKQRTIFEAFQQAEGSTSRKYGGTGLGLAISRTMAALLGGEIALDSQEGVGSTFHLYLPVNPQMDSGDRAIAQVGTLSSVKTEAGKLRGQGAEQVLASVDPMSCREFRLLIVEDDEAFLSVLIDLATEQGYQVLTAKQGREALSLAEKEQPDAIVLDLGLPDMDGIEVLEHLKAHAKTQHIPIHVISGREELDELKQQGAIGCLKKPASEEGIENVFERLASAMHTHIRQVLIVEDDLGAQEALACLLDELHVEHHAVSKGASAIKFLQQQTVDCVIVDLTLTDMSGLEMLATLSQQLDVLPPVVVYTARDLTDEEHVELLRYADSIVIKGECSPSRLVDEVTLFLHSVEQDRPHDDRKRIKMLHSGDEVLKGKRVLLVDDDMRNVFALSSELEDYLMDVVIASDGKQAMAKLQEIDSVDMVLMDIMMPVMDGYTTIEEVRRLPKFKDLPIIALTAKAMPDDKGRCMAAGASDYIAKPVDVGQLIAMMKVWLSKC